MEGEDFEWDDAKAEANRRKHKVNFHAARRVFEDPLVLILQDHSEDYGEDRFLAIGRVGDLFLAVAYAERGNRTRIISARKANAHERRTYDKG
ncbi:MAG TPA: BrnT family toxin [Hyphomicrobiaceae bacterium]|jgi:uncharacterized DUF497 family protein